jgi:TRAP-type C4-dicarboxylate transport system permease large subunit
MPSPPSRTSPSFSWPIHKTYRAILPFIAADIVKIGLLIALPGLALWLVRLLS